MTRVMIGLGLWLGGGTITQRYSNNFVISASLVEECTLLSVKLVMC